MRKVMHSMTVSAALILSMAAIGASAQQRTADRVEALSPPSFAAPAPPQPRALGGGDPSAQTQVWQPSGRGAGPVPVPLAPPNLRNEALERLAPMTPEEVLGLRRDLDARSKAMQQALEVQAKPVRRQVMLDLSPGSTPEVVRTTFAQGSILSFVDAAGRPWSVTAVENFNPAGFDAALFGTNSVSVGVLQPQARAGNIAVLVEGVATPLMFTFVTGQPEVDYALEVQLPLYVPGLPPPVGALQVMPSQNVGQLMDFLMGTPPRLAQSLKTNASQVKAWQISPTKMIVRVEGIVVDPPFSRHQASQSGVGVYEVPLTSSILVSLKTQNQLSKVAITGLSATLEQK